MLGIVGKKLEKIQGSGRLNPRLRDSKGDRLIIFLLLNFSLRTHKT